MDEPEPLWLSSQRLSPSSIPSCPLCGAARKIEFQVRLPHRSCAAQRTVADGLHHTKNQILSTVLAVLKEDDLQFDSILVYTCVDNCEIPAPAVGRAGWAEEHVEELAFAADGVDFGGPPP